MTSITGFLEVFSELDANETELLRAAFNEVEATETYVL